MDKCVVCKADPTSTIELYAGCTCASGMEDYDAREQIKLDVKDAGEVDGF